MNEKIIILLLTLLYSSLNFMMEEQRTLSCEHYIHDIQEIEKICSKYPDLQEIVKEYLSLFSDQLFDTKALSSNLFVFIQLKNISELTQQTDPELYSTPPSEELLQAFTVMRNEFTKKAHVEGSKDMIFRTFNYQCTVLYGNLIREWCSERYHKTTLDDLKECSMIYNRHPIPDINVYFPSLIESLELDSFNTYDVLEKCSEANSHINYFKTILNNPSNNLNKENEFVYAKFNSFQKNFNDFNNAVKSIDKFIYPFYTEDQIHSDNQNNGISPSPSIDNFFNF